MKKLSEINEGMFSGMVRRANTDQVKKEDVSRFDEPFKKIKEAETIYFGYNTIDRKKLYWTPFNFGASEIGQPGMYMSHSDMEELSEYLKNTDYRITTDHDYIFLRNYMSEKEKIGKYWSFVVSDRGGKKLYFPNVGYISSFYEKNNEPEEISDGDQNTIYMGTIFNNYYGYDTIMYNKNHTYSIIYTNFPDGISDKVQVRLIKIEK